MTCVICEYNRGTEECGCGCGGLICSDCAEQCPPMTEEARAAYAAARTEPTRED